MKLRQGSSFATAAVLAILYSAPIPVEGRQTSPPSTQNANKDATSAGPIRRLADGHPDLNGFWTSSAGPDTPVGGFGPPDRNIRRGDNGAKQPSKNNFTAVVRSCSSILAGHAAAGSRVARDRV